MHEFHSGDAAQGLVESFFEEFGGQDMRPGSFADVVDSWLNIAVNQGKLGPDDYPLFMRVVVSVLLQLITEGDYFADRALWAEVVIPEDSWFIPSLYPDEYRSLVGMYERHKQSLAARAIPGPV